MSTSEPTRFFLKATEMFIRNSESLYLVRGVLANFNVYTITPAALERTWVEFAS